MRTLYWSLLALLMLPAGASAQVTGAVMAVTNSEMS